MLTFYQYCSFLLPVVFLFLKGYFLSVEFSLYPYLVSRGLLPYRDILDQHLPSLFFGQFSLPIFLVDNPQKLLGILILLSLGTTFFLQEALRSLKVTNYQIWTLIYAFLSIFFLVNTLWVESFAVFLLSLAFFLNTKSGAYVGFFIGLIASQLLLIRPTLIIFLCLILFITKEKIASLLGLLLGLGLSASYLLRHQLWLDFYELGIVFNKQVYAHVQDPTITKRQAFSLIILVLLYLYLCLKNKKWFYSLLGLSTLLLVYPRFGLEHLLVFGFCFVYFLSQTVKQNYQVLSIFFICLAISLPVWLSIKNSRFGNYFYPPQLFSQAEKVKSLPGNSLYLYGASDLLYQLSGKTPTGSFYIPSLPWYLTHKRFEERLIKNLSENKEYILVDPKFSVDGQKLIDATPQIYSYIKMNYTLDGYIDHLEVYKPKP